MNININNNNCKISNIIWHTRARFLQFDVYFTNHLGSNISSPNSIGKNDNLTLLGNIFAGLKDLLLSCK
mgnify:CR=1 FL=1